MTILSVPLRGGGGTPLNTSGPTPPARRPALGPPTQPGPIDGRERGNTEPLHPPQASLVGKLTRPPITASASARACENDLGLAGRTWAPAISARGGRAVQDLGTSDRGLMNRAFGGRGELRHCWAWDCLHSGSGWDSEVVGAGGRGARPPVGMDGRTVMMNEGNSRDAVRTGGCGGQCRTADLRRAAAGADQADRNSAPIDCPAQPRGRAVCALVVRKSCPLLAVIAKNMHIFHASQACGTSAPPTPTIA